jgi:hypothetical protein
VDGILARRHHLTDYFFSLPAVDPPSRAQTIFSLAKQFTVEVETHPVKPEEYRFLKGGDIFRYTAGLPIAPRFGGWQKGPDQ